MQSSVPAQLLRSHAVRFEFQPVVDLATGHLAGFEARMRGPVGTLESSQALITAAQDEGVLEEFDRMGRFTALFIAAREDVTCTQRLFLNAECCADRERFDTELTFLDEMAPGTQIVLKVTERAAGQGVEVLAETAETARSHGWLVALDDYGRGHSSPELLPLLRPELVKLDLSVLHNKPSATWAPMLAAVDTSGATLIAGGITTVEQLHTARSVGAVWGQGRLLGEPRPLPVRTSIDPPDSLERQHLVEQKENWTKP